MTQSKPVTVKVTLPRTKPVVTSASPSPSPAPASPSPPPLGRPPRLASDDRLPPPGTRLVRSIKDKTYECVVEQDGFRLNGVLYRSLSAAASAAAREGGIYPSQNGFVFWKLCAPAKAPIASLDRRFQRYADALLKALAAADKSRACIEAEQHLERLQSLLRAASEGSAR